MRERPGTTSLIFDEVKTGLCIAPGAPPTASASCRTWSRWRRRWAGASSGAIGGTEEVFEVVENGSVYQVGTYNGNPLAMAAARASLLEVLTPGAYEHLDALNDRILAGCQKVIDDYRLPGYAVGVGAKGCVTFSPTKIVDYETYKARTASSPTSPGSTT